jgi:uncharacterized membrane protein
MRRRPGYYNDFWQEGPHHTHHEWWYGPLHVVFVLLLVALLAVAVVWFVRWLRSSSAGQASAAVVTPGAAALDPDPAVSTLRMRYAKGEVSREEFRNGMEDLTGSAAPWPGAASSKDEAPPTTDS